MFAGSDDGFIAMYDEKLNLERDWHAHEHGVNSLAVGHDEGDTTWLYSCSAFGEIKQWWPAALELIYQNTAEHPGSESKVTGNLELKSIVKIVCANMRGNYFYHSLIAGCYLKALLRINSVLFCFLQQT